MPPSVTYDTRERVWTLTEDFRYLDKSNRCVILVPRGTETDLASVPRLLRNLINIHELSLSAPILHDFIYRNGGRVPFAFCRPYHIYTRAEADRLLRDAAVEEGVAKWKAQAAYIAVRVFGRFAWQ